MISIQYKRNKKYIQKERIEQFDKRLNQYMNSFILYIIKKCSQKGSDF